MKTHAIRAAKVTALLGIAVLTGVAVALGSAMVGHEVLVLIYGDDLSVVDDTLPMVAAVSLAYMAGLVAGLVVMVLGWRRAKRGGHVTLGGTDRGGTR